MGKERSIYYISHTLVTYELNYTCIEKSYLVVMFASQKLKHYMLAHTTQLVAKIDPLKYLLNKVVLTGWLAKWMMILLEFDIQYVEKKAIKRQAIVDQSVEFPMMDDAPLQIDFPDASIMYVTEHTWKFFFDGSHTQNGASTGILFFTPHRYTIPKSYKLLFPCTNNISKYEAPLNGVKLTLK